MKKTNKNKINWKAFAIISTILNVSFALTLTPIIRKEYKKPLLEKDNTIHETNNSSAYFQVLNNALNDSETEFIYLGEDYLQRVPLDGTEQQADLSIFSTNGEAIEAIQTTPDKQSSMLTFLATYINPVNSDKKDFRSYYSIDKNNGSVLGVPNDYLNKYPYENNYYLDKNPDTGSYDFVMSGSGNQQTRIPITRSPNNLTWQQMVAEPSIDQNYYFVHGSYSPNSWILDGSNYSFIDTTNWYSGNRHVRLSNFWLSDTELFISSFNSAQILTVNNNSVAVEDLPFGFLAEERLLSPNKNFLVEDRNKDLIIHQIKPYSEVKTLTVEPQVLKIEVLGWNANSDKVAYLERYENEKSVKVYVYDLSNDMTHYIGDYLKKPDQSLEKQLIFW